MTNQTNPNPAKARPIYRLCFSAKNGIDSNGQANLAYPVEIGAAFERKDPTKGLFAKFQFVPMNIQDGVLFLIPAGTNDQEQADPIDGETGQ